MGMTVIGSIIGEAETVATGGWWPIVKRLLPFVGVALIALAVWHWYSDKVAAAYERGSNEQNAADGRAVTRAFIAATAEQHATVIAAVAKSDAISKEKAHDLASDTSDTDRAAAAIGMRHDARQAALSAAGNGGAVALPGAGPVADEAACATEGGLPFNAALALATDAEHDADTLRALQGWVRDQAAAWPISTTKSAPPPITPEPH
jgi:hypothetical protein